MKRIFRSIVYFGVVFFIVYGLFICYTYVPPTKVFRNEKSKVSIIDSITPNREEWYLFKNNSQKRKVLLGINNKFGGNEDDPVFKVSLKPQADTNFQIPWSLVDEIKICEIDTMNAELVNVFEFNASRLRNGHKD